jgi:hypothetical protein
MVLQNRVTPTGYIIADPARGTLMGNRGVLHDADRRMSAARWRHQHWIFCRLAFKGRRRQIMAPRRYTELFFLDEVTALAAGHRPCCECRREDFLGFQAAWRQALGVDAARAPAIDRVLHRARVEPRSRTQVRFEAHLGDLPDGAFVLLPDDATPLLVWGDRLHPWHPDGYGPPRPRRSGRVKVLTPAPTVAVLRAGYAPSSHLPSRSARC